MTIDEAICHCKEVAEQQERMARLMDAQLVGSAIEKYQNECVECAMYHRQLAEWLTEFKELKQMDFKETVKALVDGLTKDIQDMRAKIHEYEAKETSDREKFINLLLMCNIDHRTSHDGIELGDTVLQGDGYLFIKFYKDGKFQEFIHYPD